MVEEKRKDEKKKKSGKEGEVKNEIEVNPSLDEALNRKQRRARSISMRKNKAKLKAGRRKAKNKPASKEKLKSRARKKAISSLRSKLASGKSYNSLSASQKETIDKKIEKRKTLVNRLAKKYLPKVKKADRNKRTKKEEVDYNLNETPRIRFHQIVDKNGKHKFDRRFKAFKDISKPYSDYGEPKINAKDLDELGYTVNEAFDLLKFKNRGQIKKAVEKVRKYVERGVDKFDIVNEISRSIGVSPKELLKAYDKAYNDSSAIDEEFEELFLERNRNDVITFKQIREFEKFVDKLFKKFGIDFNFTRHFADRIDDPRNNPEITLKELAEFMKKIYKKQGKSLKSVKDAQAVIIDMQKDLNIPVVVEYDPDQDDFDVVMKTIMRKKDFKTSNRTIRY